MRMVIDLSPEMIRGLAEIGRKENKSQDELILDAIQHFLDARKSTPMSAVFGLWADYKVDALDCERVIRDEWTVTSPCN